MKTEKHLTSKGLEFEKTIRNLLEKNQKLERELKKKISIQNDLESALTVERELGAVKNKFLSLASHEFRTPLSAIYTSAILVEKYLEENSRGKKHTMTIKAMVKQLSKILEDFLSLDKLERGKIKYQYSDFDFNVLIQEIIDEAEYLLKEGQKIDYTPCDECIRMVQDRKILHLIITNILFNAIKYSPENTDIILQITYTDSVSITIIDKGIGIPEEDQEKIFNRFFRASNVANIDGTGIGLNIVKSNVDALGGTITFSSKQNIGTTFIVNLPKIAQS